MAELIVVLPTGLEGGVVDEVVVGRVVVAVVVVGDVVVVVVVVVVVEVVVVVVVEVVVWGFLVKLSDATTREFAKSWGKTN